MAGAVRAGDKKKRDWKTALVIGKYIEEKDFAALCSLYISKITLGRLHIKNWIDSPMNFSYSDSSVAATF